MQRRSYQQATSRSKKRSIIIGVIIVLALLGTAGIVYGIMRSNDATPTSNKQSNDSDRPVNDVDYGPSDATDNNASEDRKNEGDSDNDGTLDSGQAGTNMVVTVTRASVVSGALQVGTLVSGAQTGSCTVTVSQQGQQDITQTAPLQLDNNAYACPVFSIPTSQFPNQNDWNVSVSVTSGSSTKTSSWQANPVSLTER